MKTSITIISSPYHVGIPNHRVGDGPNRLKHLGLIEKLSRLNIQIHTHTIPPVDDFEGEIGRSFELLRRTSTAVSEARAHNSFPLVLSGNCMASVGVACGLDVEDLGFVYLDAHDDMDTPSTNVNGYLDAMGLSVLAGKSFHALARTIPGFRVREFGRFVYCGLRDVSDVQVNTVREAGVEVVWGGASSGERVDFARRLGEKLGERDYSPALVHLDLDVLDESVGKVNGFESPGGMMEGDLLGCMDVIPRFARPVALTVCSFNPNLGDGDKVAEIGVEAVVGFVKALIETGELEGDERKE